MPLNIKFARPADTGPAIDKLAKVFAPFMVIELTDVDVKLNAPNDNPPRFIVPDAEEMLIADDPALKVKFVFVVKVNVPVAVIVLVPKLIDRVFALVDDRLPKVNGKFPVSKEPFVTEKVLAPKFAVLPSVQPHPTPLTATEDASATPFVVNVLPVADPVNVIAPV